MKKIETNIEGLFVIELNLFHDNRGFFMERYNKDTFKQLGLNIDFIQDNQSKSFGKVVRGLHAQPGQGKLVGAIKGSILDVAVDIRPKSSTFGQYFSIELSEDNNKLLWIPDGFLHGFQVISDEASVLYKVTSLFNPDTQFGVIWNDPEIGIKWPHLDAIISSRDAILPKLKDALK